MPLTWLTRDVTAQLEQLLTRYQHYDYGDHHPSDYYTLTQMFWFG
jgi:hypothetical protein